MSNNTNGNGRMFGYSSLQADSEVKIAAWPASWRPPGADRLFLCDPKWRRKDSTINIVLGILPGTPLPGRPECDSVAAKCSIEVSAHGNAEPKVVYGHVKLDNELVWQSAWGDASVPDQRGVNVLVVNPFNCSLVEPVLQFDTHLGADAAIELTYHLQQVDHGGVIVAVSADEPTQYLCSAVTNRPSICATP